MDDQPQDTATASASGLIHGGADPNQPLRSRWTPKPEQILILESIFNSGMVNPPKDETVKIRKLLEQFGSVGDANVFYWFQNRRSRSRRRQRQIQAAAAEQLQAPPPCGAGIQYGNPASGGFAAAQSLPNYHVNMGSSCFAGSCSSSSSSYGFGDINDGNNSDDHLFGFSGNFGPFQQFEQSSNFCSGDASNFHHQSGYYSEVITVFINGVATEVGRGPVDMKAMFDVDSFVLVNEHGFLVQSFQHGESYFLVPRQS